MTARTGTASVHTCGTEHFPALRGGTASILVTVDDVTDFTVHTNLGADLTLEETTQVVGTLLHQLSHILTAGQTVDVSDLYGDGAL